ncbi:MAG: hypothetical protein R3B72_14010 [Polyangiaceae bacterium]
MESLAATLDELKAILNEEREALARADASRVLELAELKRLAMQDLVDGGIADAPALAKDLSEVVTALRDNLVLLVHARALVSEVLESISAAPATYHSQTPRVPRGARLSVQG